MSSVWELLLMPKLGSLEDGRDLELFAAFY
jgi:hypothetical protein